jgi:hypothetical protein
LSSKIGKSTHIGVKNKVDERKKFWDYTVFIVTVVVTGLFICTTPSSGFGLKKIKYNIKKKSGLW